MTEKIAKARGHELESIESKQFWEHYQVREWLKELKGYRNLQDMIGIPFKEHAALCREHIPDDAKYPSKAIVLTDESVDEWNQYKADKEQGLLLRLPCAIGSTVYALTPFCEICEEYLDNEYACENCNKGKYAVETKFDYEMIPMVGKVVFLTSEEAEQALAKMEGE